MKIMIKNNGAEFDQAAANLALASLCQDRRVNVSLTGGSSPKGAYVILADELRNNKDQYQSVHYYGFDNMDHDQYEFGYTQKVLEADLYGPAELSGDKIHYLTSGNYQTYDAEIAAAGGLDFMLIGLGADGHFCGNMPGYTVFDKESYSVDISKDTRLQDILSSEYTDSKPSAVCVTMGPVSVMRVRQLVMLVNGKHKAEAVKKLIESPVETSFPSSVLKLHPNFILLLDQDAASLL